MESRTIILSNNAVALVHFYYAPPYDQATLEKMYKEYYGAEAVAAARKEQGTPDNEEPVIEEIRLAEAPDRSSMMIKILRDEYTASAETLTFEEFERLGAGLAAIRADVRENSFILGELYS
jgi:uncharacterized protein YtpQ (UPF0354 family)